MKSLLRTWVRTSVITKGVKGRSNFWLGVGALGLLMRLFDTNGRRTERVALNERLLPGDELLLRYPGKPGRSTRRKIAESRRREAAELEARSRALSQLRAKADRGGFGGRRASKKLNALTSTRK